GPTPRHKTGTSEGFSRLAGSCCQRGQLPRCKTGAPTRIQIWGTFIFCKNNASYDRPVSGYFYYKAESGKEEVCRNPETGRRQAHRRFRVLWPPEGGRSSSQSR